MSTFSEDKLDVLKRDVDDLRYELQEMAGKMMVLGSRQAIVEAA